ncbi:hypothetical protein GCM10007860_15970 [Chitiniphilus shinanonensis]|uniref:chitinase n=1 Tax=Chitiniphilus shinanonensis TaxID=553088 RepID=F8WSU6_9NEIS|nr:glycosyl hydrolase family 18 protein [Chitiniphilus shinanonensis]BAK53933.1 family 18 chitinase [Chitiniphilus shinanonensis]GLS04450.1 hypothetical protein GCM10007860_15970 [Chitiniphilus shinanonensis]
MSRLKRFTLAALPAVLAAYVFAAAPAWQEGTVYATGDVVSYAGAEYRARTTHTAHIGANWNPASSPTLWVLVAGGGGEVTPPPITPPAVTPVVPVTPTPVATGCHQAWSSTEVYLGGALVTYNGRNYKAGWYTKGDEPTKGGEWGVWKDQGACAGDGEVTPVPVTPVPVTPVPVTPVPVTPVPVTPVPVTPVPVTPVPPGGTQVGAYFSQWGVYGRGYEVADIDRSGAAAKLTFINYAFGNIYQRNGGYECASGINRRETGATNPNAPDAGLGGDAWADYVREPTRLVDPSKTTSWGAPLRGNFNELKNLKAKYPNLKVLISLGGWTWSKWFSAASATDALRKQLVSSCIDVYIKGNLAAYDGSGGAEAAKGVFDGIDIDWEFPASHGGQPYNTVSPADTRNFTLLMQEFRTQLDALNDGHKLLTAAMGAGKDKIDLTEPAEYSKYLDWINIMSYDYNGTWAAQGPTDFQAHLYPDPTNPNAIDSKTGEPSLATYYNTDSAVKSLIAKGIPAKKLHLGIPYYGRGWTGVQPGPNGDGLYQAATGAATGTYEAGNEDYKVLKNAPGTVYYHPTTKQSWKYDGNNWWSYDTPQDIAVKVEYIKEKGLGGAFGWSLDGDTPEAELTKEMAKVRN